MLVREMIINLNICATRMNHRISSQTSHAKIVVDDDKIVKKRSLELMKQRLDMGELHLCFRLCV